MNLTATSRTFAGIICAALALPIANSFASELTDEPASGARNLDQLAVEIRSTNEQLEALKRKLGQNLTLKKDLQSSFAQTRQKRGDRDERLATLTQRIDQFSTRLDEMDETLAAAADDIEQKKNTLAKALRNAQSISTNTGLKALLQHDDPVTAQRLSTYEVYLFDAQNRQVLSALTYLETLKEARLSALKDRNWLIHIKSKARDQRDKFAKAEASTRQQIDSVKSELEQTTRSVEQLEQDQQRLQSLMTELESLQRAGSGYFAAYKGQFALPVSGTIAARFGEQKSVGKLRWDGLYINAIAGKPVNAVADGAVVYSDWLQGFGMLVIVDHGDSYMTLYGGNREVLAETGTWVSSGTTIASVGDSGGQNTSGLYFEIRHKANALDPLEWLSDAAIASVSTNN